MLESPTQRSIWLASAALAGVILFRVNTGQAWVSGGGPAKRLPDGNVLLRGGRPVSLGFGLINGAPVAGAGDICGWRTVTITPEMVGCRIAVFASIEAKRGDGKGRTSVDQLRWRDTIIAAGGIAGVAASPEEAIAIFNTWRPPKTAGVRTE